VSSAARRCREFPVYLAVIKCDILSSPADQIPSRSKNVNFWIGAIYTIKEIKLQNELSLIVTVWNRAGVWLNMTSEQLMIANRAPALFQTVTIIATSESSSISERNCELK
jgi:hypothetical protein